MGLKIYHNPRCSKSRQTLGIIEEKGVDVEVIEYLKDVPSKKELSAVLSKLNMNPSQIVRKGEPIFKEKFKGKELTEDEWLDAFIEYPKLIERPIVVKDKRAVLGRPPENVLDLL